MRRRWLVAFAIVASALVVTASPAAAANSTGAGNATASTHTDFGTGDEASPARLENFSIYGSGDSAAISGPVGGTQKVSVLADDGTTFSWNESDPSNSESVVNLTGKLNTETDSKTGSIGAGTSSTDISISPAGTTDPSGPASGEPEVTLTGHKWTGSNTINQQSSPATIGVPDGETLKSASGTLYHQYCSQTDTAYLKLTINGSTQTLDSTSSSSCEGISVSWSGSKTIPEGASAHIDFTWSNDYFEYRDGSAAAAPPQNVTVSTASDTATLGDFTDGESKSAALNLSESDSSMTVELDGGELDYNLTYRERTQTVDPAVQLNSDTWINHSGTLGDGETVIKSIPNSALQSSNTGLVELPNESLSADAPAMQVRTAIEVPAQSAAYVSANHTNVEHVSGVQLNWSGNGTLAIDVQKWTGSQWQLAREASLSQTGVQTVEFAPINATKTRVKITTTKAVTIERESVVFTNDAPAIANVKPADGTQLTKTGSVAFNASISDPEFATAQGDELRVTLSVDGSVVGTTNITANQSVGFTTTLTAGGTHTYEWTIEDSYGATTTERGTVSLPSTLTIRNESNASQIINASGTAEVRFFGSDGAVYSRPIDNGTVSFEGLPAGTQFTAVIDANGYKPRRIIIPSLTEQQTAFVQPTNADSVEVVFEIQSPTGQFPPQETTLYVEKPIQLNNTTKYRTIAADSFGASGGYPVDMLPGTRYRLRVETVNGTNSRVLGAYTPVTSTVETLQIQRVAPRSNVNAGAAVYGGLMQYNNSTSIAVRHRDLGEAYKSVEYRIERGDGTVIVPNTTLTADTYAAVYPLTPNNSTTYTVYYTATLPDGSTVSGSFSTGTLDTPGGGLPIDKQVLSILSWVTILATMGLLVIINTSLAPIGGVAVASALTILGTIAIPLPILGVGGVVAALNAFGGGR